MIVLLDTSHNLRDASAELGCPGHQLLTPLTRFRPQYPDEPFAIDNGAFKHFDAKDFQSLLAREEPRKSLCKFVAVPDVVASARKTLESFDAWYPVIRSWPLALVAQDGQTDVPIPWDKIAAIFIGGSTRFKLSAEARLIIAKAQMECKWVHVGRVNSPRRFQYFEDLGVNSVDGSGLARYSWMRERVRKRHQQPYLALTA